MASGTIIRMCISSECRLVKTDFDSTRIMAQAVANNYRSDPHIIAYLVSIAVCMRQPYSSKQGGLWLLASASRVRKMLGAKLGFRVLITSADLLPRPPTAVSGTLAAGFGPSAMLRGPPPDTARQTFSVQLPILDG